MGQRVSVGHKHKKPGPPGLRLGRGSDDISRLDNMSRNMKKTFGQATYEGWNFNSGNYLFTTDTK